MNCCEAYGSSTSIPTTSDTSGWVLSVYSSGGGVKKDSSAGQVLMVRAGKTSMSA